MSKNFWIGALVLIFFFPATYSIYKFVFSGIVLIAVLLMVIKRKPRYVNLSLGVGNLGIVWTGLCLIAYDFIQVGNWSSVQYLSFWVVAPFVYFLLMVLLSCNPSCVEILDTSIFLASLLISLNSLGYVASGILHVGWPLGFLDLNYGIGLDERGFVAFTTNNLPILGFSIPFMMASMVLAKGRSPLRAAALILSILATLTSLRLAIIIDIAATIPLLLLFARSTKLKIWIGGVLAAMAVATAVVFLLFSDVVENNPIVKGIYSLKLAQKVSGEDLRYKQMVVWLQSLSERPLLGHGLSSTDITLNGDDKIVLEHRGPIVNPYGYELTYLKMLSEIGLIPCTIYAVFAGGLLIHLVLLGRNGHGYQERNCLSYAFGLLLFLFTSGTNGYLLTFGYIWTVFLPCIYLNHLLSRKAGAAT